MIKFENLHDAFNHQPYCPFCRERITIGYDSIKNGYSPTLERMSEEVSLRSGSTSFVMDCIDNILLSWEDSGANLQGMYMFRVLCWCPKCSKYGFVLQVHADLTNMVVAGVFLNSETVSIEKGKTLHEIKNVYPMNQTEYQSSSNVVGEELNPVKSLKLPLIPLDIQNPEKTLERIRNLIIFS